MFDTMTTRRIDTALALLRLIAGVIFIAHGGQKLFVFGFDGVAAGFSQMGIPLPGLTGPLVALVEFFGGIALVIGMLTRLAALGLAVTMVGAILMVHLAGGFFLPAGSEFALALLGVSIALALTGAGSFSIDGLIARRRGAAHATV
jgi:putative oxidoreductase